MIISVEGNTITAREGNDTMKFNTKTRIMDFIPRKNNWFIPEHISYMMIEAITIKDKKIKARRKK